LHPTTRVLLCLVIALCAPRALRAQLPFYTDDPSVTDPWVWHFEFFNEYDALHFSEYPNLRQNTANFRLNYGLPHGLELDLDAPYLSIFRAPGDQASSGGGDTDMGVKWKFRDNPKAKRLPMLATSLYIEFPTGNVHEQLGSGLTDYWLTFIAQQPITDKTRINVNLGFLFAGNTSTGVVGIQTTRGHVYIGGLSFMHDFTPRLTLGAEVYGGVADNPGLGRSQLQFLAGGQYAFHKGMTFDFALLGGKYAASPQIGGQIGFSVDLPSFPRRTANSQSIVSGDPAMNRLLSAPQRRYP
jgi:hypothetical protein